MAQPDLEPIGSFERAVQPTLNRFRLNAEMDLNTVLSPDSARATVRAFEILTQRIDLMEAERTAAAQVIRTLSLLVLTTAIVACVAMFA